MTRLALLVPAALLSAAIIAAAQSPAPAQPTAPAKPEEKPAAPAAAKPADEPKPVKREEREGGLILEDLVLGSGPEVKPGGVIVAHYRGTLKDGGTEFDSSYKRGEPATFPLKNLVKGWQEGIPGMRVGGKRRLTVPWALAYGEAGRPPVIPPKADLVFEIEVLDTIVVTDIQEGAGQAFAAGANPTIKYTIRRVGGTDSISGTDKPDAPKPGAAKSADGSHAICSSEKPEDVDFRYLIPGLQYGLDGMKVGGKRKLVFPSQMGWQQKPSPLPGDAHLECEVELVAVQAMAPAGIPDR